MDEEHLAALRAKFPLPDDQPDDVVNRTLIAEAMDVSANTITQYLQKGMPCQTVGGNGKDYEFRLADCYAWRMEMDAEARERRVAGAAAAAQMALLFRNDDDGDGSPGVVLTARQIMEESEADYKRNRAAEMRRDLVRTHRVQELFEDVLVEFRTQITTLVDFSEMEFGLTPEQVDVLQRRCDGALIQARRSLEQVTAQGDVVPFREEQESLPV